MCDLSLKLIDHGATHVSGNAESWLDLCMVDESDTVTAWSKSTTPMGAGHFLIAVDLSVQCIRP